MALAAKLAAQPSIPSASTIEELLKEQTDVSLELAKTLLVLHGALFDIRQLAQNNVAIAVFFPAARIRLGDGTEK
jgi:hypothetical protein